MKKIRFLAALLVILMLPLSVLFGCKKPEEKPEDDPEEEEGGGETGGGTGNGGSGNVSTTPIDNDGLSGNGYLVMFHFDAAKRGNLNVDVAPYKRFFTVDTGKSGTAYSVDDKMGKNGTGALLIERKGTNASSNVAFMTTALGSSFDSQHTLEFDIKLGKGLLGDTLEVIADKKAKQTLVSISPDGKIVDCDGMLLYEANKLEGEWVHIAIAVDDRACKYDVYINGVKRATEVAFSNKSYSTTEDLEQYSFKLAGMTYEDTYCYIDNLGLIDGLTPKEYTSDNVVYRDYYVQNFDVFTASKVDTNGNVLPNLDALIGVYDTVAGFTNKVTSDPYNSNSALAMNELLTIVKVDSTGNIVDDVYTDFGVVKGLYDYGAPVGGKLFTYGTGEDAKFIDFDSNKYLTFTAKNLLGDGATVNGIYEVYGNDAAQKIKLTFGDNLDQILYLYCKIESGVISTYADDKFLTLNTAGYTSASQPFNKVEYSYSDDTVTLSVLVNEFTGKASLVINDGTLDINVSDATFAYSGTTLTVTVESTPYEFTYENGTFKYDGKTLTKTVEEEYIPYDEADEYEYVLKYTNFKTGVPEFAFQIDMTNFDTDRWDRFNFEYYITDEMASGSYQFLVYIDTGKSADGGMRYLNKVIKHSSSGWYTLDIPFEELDAARNADWEDFSGKVYLAMSGWSNGPTGAAGQAADGYTLLVRNISFVSEVAVVVDGPDAPAEGEEPCEHVDDDGNSLLVPVAERVDPTCTTGGYAIVKCSECNATKVDKTKPITDPNGHDYTGAVEYTKNCTCTLNGYKYHYCNVCGEMEETEILTSPGHDIVDTYIPSKNSILSTCRICGEETEVKLSNELLSFPDKLSMGALEATEQYFYAAEGNKYANLINGGFDLSANTYLHEIIRLMCAYSTATAEKLSDGTYGIRLERNPVSGSEAYIDYMLNKQFGEGGHFVCEFDFRLGEADANGKYPGMAATIIERMTDANGGPTETLIFSINEDGVLTFRTDADAKIAFSSEKFTNVAMVFKPTENAMDIYVDGYKEYTIPMGDEYQRDYFMAMSWSQLRISYTVSPVAGEGQYYFNNFAAYAGNFPICVRGVGNSNTGSAEHIGDIMLKDESGEYATYPLNVVDADKVLNLPDDINTSKYSLEFKLSASAALTNGTLLVGQKRDEYMLDDNVLALLTVKDGWLYFCDTVIADLTNIAGGMNIKISFNDVDGGANVYINGAEVLGGFIYYPEMNALVNMYNDPDSRIKSLTFDSEVGAYTVSDLRLVGENA